MGEFTVINRTYSENKSNFEIQIANKVSVHVNSFIHFSQLIKLYKEQAASDSNSIQRLTVTAQQIVNGFEVIWLYQ